MLQKNYLPPKSEKRVLVVDDEFDIGLWLKTVLEGNGFTVDYYCNPLIALKEFKPNFYELLILDIKMPLMDGFQFYREIRKRDGKPKICFLTAGEETEDIKTELSDAVYFIRKPIENEELLLIINVIVNK